MPFRINTLTISPNKISGYMLNVHHIEGGSKARWFLARGYRVDTPQQLANDLAGHAFLSWPGDVIEAAPHGVKRRIVAPLLCPDGTAPDVLSVWLVETGNAFASFVTARPYHKKGTSS